MRVLRPLVAAAAALFMFAAPASARDVRVALDQAFPIRLSEPAEGVAIGNPSIAGVTVENDMFLFVTGRSPPNIFVSSPIWRSNCSADHGRPVVIES